jgi:hypothetical protein
MAHAGRFYQCSQPSAHMSKRMGMGIPKSQSNPARAISASCVADVLQRVNVDRVPPASVLRPRLTWRHGEAVVAHATAAERRRGKDSTIQTSIGQVDLGLSITARAVNFGLEAEHRHLAKRREGQPMPFTAAFRLRHDQAPMLGPDPCPRGSPNGFRAACRINSLPAVPAPNRLGANRPQSLGANGVSSIGTVAKIRRERAKSSALGSLILAPGCRLK